MRGTLTNARVALIGYGFATKVFHAPLVASVPGLELAAIVSSDPANVRADFPNVTIHDDAEAAFADPTIDLVVIATPNDTHAPLATRALASGKHVVVDKPFVLNAAEGRELAALAARNGRLLSIFQNRRYDGDFLTLRRAIDDGELGDVVRFESRFERYRPSVRDRWRERDEPGGGLWYDLGPHLIDQALNLFGRPLAIAADLAREREGARAVDAFVVTLRYSRKRAILAANMLASTPGPRFLVHGTRGTYAVRGLDAQEDALRAGADPADAAFGHNPQLGTIAHGEGAARDVPTAAGTYRRYYELVRDALAGAPNPVPPSDAIAVAEIIDAGLQSDAERREIPL